MKTSEGNPSDWFFLANERLASADALLVARGACYSAVELLHESVERYLKGYLVERGWQLERTAPLHPRSPIHDPPSHLSPRSPRDLRVSAFRFRLYR